MRILTHTNIIVDDFEMCKDYPSGTFIHFLTHFHQDHWQGMTPLWNYGVVFCTEMTKRFILQRFPKLTTIITLEYGKEYLLDVLKKELVAQQTHMFVIKVYAFDAHHIPGAAMYLFQGYMGTILHTGDFRFNPKMIYENPILFPRETTKEIFKLSDEADYDKAIMMNCHQLKAISIPVDEMIYDNTYCNKMFDFPLADVVAKQMISIIEANPNKRVYIAMGALGKENICLTLSSYFQTLIVVGQSKYDQIEASQYVNMQIFTTNQSEGWIEIIKRSRREDILNNLATTNDSKDYICITIDFLMLEHYNPDGINFIVPYSLHSNFKEMETLVRCICPAILKKLVVPFETFPEYRRKARINPLKRFKSYLTKLEQDGESGYSQFVKFHTDFSRLSKEYSQWMHEGISTELMQKLGVCCEPSREHRKRKANQVVRIGPGERLRQLSKEYVFGRVKYEKKESLQQVADQLKGTSKNELILKYLKPREGSKQKEQSDK